MVKPSFSSEKLAVGCKVRLSVVGWKVSRVDFPIIRMQSTVVGCKAQKWGEKSRRFRLHFWPAFSNVPMSEKTRFPGLHVPRKSGNMITRLPDTGLFACPMTQTRHGVCYLSRKPGRYPSESNRISIFYWTRKGNGQASDSNSFAMPCLIHRACR